ncbi:helix-turn-helix transcriptional regulator [Kribbella sp. NPDC051137]|uniref:helix-turn-helix transcriptional regulator n=1 Tax=Kribbella sp. NPDC051137 TaxID=3155045 RepID=UPI0034274981
MSGDTLAVYRVLLEQPSFLLRSRFSDLCAYLKLPEEAVTVELGRLREFGLLVPRWNTRDEEYPLHPSVGLERLATQRQKQLDALTDELQHDRLTAGQFVADYTEFLAERTARDVEVFEGRELAYERMQQFRPTKSAWGMLPYVDGDFPDAKPNQSPDQPLLERGVETRYLVAETQMKHRVFKEGYFFYFSEYGAKVRTTPSLPMKLLIFDGESAVMGIDPDDTSVGAVVHHSRTVVRLAEEMFLKYWENADDAFGDSTPRRTRGVTPQEGELLKLLVQGATDEQVARKLAVSMRTVRRIVAKLSEQVGASGRFELGVRAAQRGWVD